MQNGHHKLDLESKYEIQPNVCDFSLHHKSIFNINMTYELAVSINDYVKESIS